MHLSFVWMRSEKGIQTRGSCARPLVLVVERVVLAAGSPQLWAGWSEPQPRHGMGSDPGPRFKEVLTLADDEPEPDVGSNSIATENSDEEPLEGEPLDHVEAMLARCLQPDERTQHDDEADDDADDDYSSDDELDAALLNEQEVTAGDGAAADAAGEGGSDVEDLEEAIALRMQLYTIKQGIHDFEAWSSSYLGPHLAAVEATDSVRTVRSDQPGGSAPAALHELRRHVGELRELHRHIKLLVLNQQALCAHYTQHLLNVTHTQAEMAMRRHKECQRRHKQLRIVRRESARLCRSLEDIRALPPRVGVACSSSSGSSMTLSPNNPPSRPPPPAFRGLSEVPAAARAISFGGGGSPCGARCGCDAAGAADAPLEMGSRVLLKAISPAGAKGGSGTSTSDAAGLSNGELERSATPYDDMVRLVHRSCGLAARKLDRGRGATPPPPSSRRRGNGLTAEAATAYALPFPSAKLSAGRDSGRTHASSGVEHAAAGRPGLGGEAHARTLRNPVVQAAIAEALWQLVAEPP